MQRLAALYASFAWWKLVPSELSGMRLLVTSANGNQASAGGNYVAAAQADDGSFLWAYVPPTGGGAQNLTVDLRSLRGNARARFWDPTNGNYTDASAGAYSLPNSTAAQAFATPGANSAGDNDWILVLDTQ